MKVAISTNDGKILTPDHFGGGEYFLIYNITREGYELVEKRKNTSSPEEEHGSAEKAKGIVAILQDIPVLLGYQFGPNIMRIKNRFLPVISREKDIKNALKLLQKNLNIIEEGMGKKGEMLVILSNYVVKIVKMRV